MTLDRQSKNLTYDFDELTIWRTKLPDVKHAILPPSNNRPNPRVIDGLVVVSIFSPGAICALDRKTGMLAWRREFHELASAAVYDANGTLFAKTLNTLHALEPETGKSVWSFCPHGDSGETMYSSPTVPIHVVGGQRRVWRRTLQCNGLSSSFLIAPLYQRPSRCTLFPCGVTYEHLARRRG
jgi:outer membrane protein assembly factor BamB